MIKETRIVDDATGQVHSCKVQHIAAAFHEEKGYLFWARKSFTKSFLDVPFPKELTHAEIGKLTILAKKIWANTNMLGYRGNGSIKPYSMEQIRKIIDLKPYQTGVFIRKMIYLGILARVYVEVEGKKETQFYINPIYFFSSNRIPLNLYLIFRKQLDKVLPEWVKEEYTNTEKKVDKEQQPAEEPLETNC